MSHDAIDEFPPSLPLPEAPAVPTALLGHHSDDPTAHALLQCVHQLTAHQAHQTDLLQKLHKTVLTSRSMINELVVSNNELKQEIRKIRYTAQCENCRQKDSDATTTYAAEGLLSVAAEVGQGPGDEEIDNIINSRKRKQSWPVKHGTLNCFSVQQDLVKIRFHHSAKYQHIPVRIPKTDKNKDGTKPCKLCSEGKVRRKTTWMCSTCEVPLCTRPLMDESGTALTHHTKWHGVRDLIAEHKRCHDDLKDGREMRKRAKVSGECQNDEVHNDVAAVHEDEDSGERAEL